MNDVQIIITQARWIVHHLRAKKVGGPEEQGSCYKCIATIGDFLEITQSNSTKIDNSFRMCTPLAWTIAQIWNNLPFRD